MIVDHATLAIGGVEVMCLTADFDFYAVVYASDLRVLYFTKEDDPLRGVKRDGAMQYPKIYRKDVVGFAASTYAEMLAEAERRGLTFPPEEEEEDEDMPES